jgi:parallel beta-helix repeat protein
MQTLFFGRAITSVVLVAAMGCGRIGFDSQEQPPVVEEPGDPGPIDEPILEPTSFIAPDGSDDNEGSYDAPWKTWSYALSQLSPGSVLGVFDGDYTQDDAGALAVHCGISSAVCAGGPCENGVAGEPIVVRAINWRQAVIHSNGEVPGIEVESCTHWVFQGLTILGSDLESPASQASTVTISDSSALVLDRLLVVGTNRYANVSAIDVGSSTQIRIVGNEVYDYHRHGISIDGGNNLTVRGNYEHRREYLRGHSSEISLRLGPPAELWQ